MSTTEFMAHLRALDIRVSVDGERLRCSAPKGMLTDGLREELAARKAEILAWLRANVDGHDVAARALAADGYHEPLSFAQRRRRGMEPLQPCSVASIAGESHVQESGPVRMPREGDLPLSFAQQRLWFLDQLEPGTSAYTIAVRRRLRGPLDVTALASACTELVRRHESLRTTFVSKEGQPVQRIVDPEPVTLGIVDLERHAAADRDRVAGQIVHAEVQRPFDLVHGPLFRPVLLRRGPEEHELLVSVHHIVADGWSLGILTRELDALYAASVAGRPSPLPELPIQYADFALWQRQWLAGEVLETQLRYWLERLGSQLAPLDLPTDHPRSSRPTYAGASHDFVLPRPLADRLRELSRRQGATPFMTLLAAFKALLARYTGQEDIVVGTAVANRHYVELETVIGLFANTLALRTDLAGDPTFRELLARVRETCLDAYAHPDMPFEKLVEELQPERILGQNPLFQVSFVWQDTAMGADLAFVTVASPFDLTLFVRDGTDGTLGATIQYKRDLFEPETIARLAGHYCTLLEGVAADPDYRLSALPLLTPAERHCLLIEWNDTASVYPTGTVAEVFESQVERAPEAVALLYREQQLTYRQLNRCANRVAHRLRALGVGPDRLVAVCMERSLDMVIAYLGILKAGGAYVPLDPAYPPERLAFMLADSGAAALLAHHMHLSRLPNCQVPTICLDADTAALERESPENPARVTGPEHLAYVMYTSGSTGVPKGVEIPHRGILRLLFGMSYARLGPEETVLHASSPSFDLTTFEIWGPLLHGGRCVLCAERVPTPDTLREVIAKHGVTTIWLTGSLFNSIVDVAPEVLRGVQQLLVGGEALSVLHVRRAAEVLPSTRIINGYGPTEATTFTCCYDVPGPPTADATSIPIGRPIANTRVYVLDRHRSPVPIGVPGELWIAGDGLARGYVNRPQLTAERFVVHRLAETLEERLYRSGDRGRWRGDGTLEFLGRLDDQVKVRGYRIELGEIEATLVRHPRVRAAAVVARQTAHGERRLVAYVVGDGSVDARDLRAFLRSKLPDYMVPTVFVWLAALPLTPNGKVDRQALPASDWMDYAPEHEFVAPRDRLEEQIAQTWEEMLGVQPIGIHDNFFTLGGDSLLAVRLCGRLDHLCRTAVPLAMLFQAPTVAQLADRLRQVDRPAPPSRLLAYHPSGSKPPFFCVHGVKLLARYLDAEQPYYTLQSHALDGLRAPDTIEAIAADYLKDIQAVQPEGPYFLGGFSVGGMIAFELAQQLRQQGQTVALLVLIDPTSLLYGSVARRSIMRRIKDLGRKIVAEVAVFYLAHGRRVPPMLRMSYFHVASLRAASQYTPRHSMDSLILLQAAQRADDLLQGWRRLAAGRVERYIVPGNHFTMIQEPHVRVLAERLTLCLHQAQAMHAPGGLPALG